MKKILVAAWVCAALFVMSSCREKTATEKMQDQVEELQENLKDAVDEGADGVKKALEEMEDGLEKMKKKSGK